MSPPSSKSRSLKLRSLPIIDIGPWTHAEDEHYRGHNGGRRSTSAAIHAACLTYGFFYLDISSCASQAEMDELANLARKFFSLPQEQKDKLAVSNQDGVRGYRRMKENVTDGKADNHESLDFYASVSEPNKSRLLWGENQWPDNDTVRSFKDNYMQWVEKMKGLGMIVMEAMSVGLGMTKEEWEELKGKVDDSFWIMRTIGYPPLPNDYDGFSCGAHYGCLTFLYTDPAPNVFQVLLPQPGILDDAATFPVLANAIAGIAPGAAKEFLPSDLTTEFRHDELSGSYALSQYESSPEVNITSRDEMELEGGKGVWINADPLPGCVMCNIGEMWEIWTNGLYKSTLYRAIHRGSNYRVSIPFFFEPNFTARVSPLPAALRLQRDSIQSAYAYGQHTTLDMPNSAEDSSTIHPTGTLSQRMDELMHASNLSGSQSSESTVSMSSGASEDGADTNASTPHTSPPRSLDLRGLSSALKPQLLHHSHSHSLSHSHHAQTLVGVEERYKPVVYGELLVRKVIGESAS